MTRLLCPLVWSGLENGGSLGIGFAIPISIVQEVMNQIIRQGRVIRGYIGVEPQDLTPELTEALQLPTQQKGASRRR